jgi:hypothetical protein
LSERSTRARASEGRSVEPSASGVGVIEVRRALIEAVGEPVFARALATLPAELRDEYENISPFGWVKLSTSGAVLDAVAAEAKLDAEALFDRVLRAGVERSFKTVWKVLLHFTSDDALIARTSLVYGKSRNIGQLSARITSPGQVEATLTGWPGMADRHARGIAISMAVVLELAGRKDARYFYHRTADGAVFKLTWRV